MFIESIGSYDNIVDISVCKKEVPELVVNHSLDVLDAIAMPYSGYE